MNFLATSTTRRHSPRESRQTPMKIEATPVPIGNIPNPMNGIADLDAIAGTSRRVKRHPGRET